MRRGLRSEAGKAVTRTTRASPLPVPEGNAPKQPARCEAQRELGAKNGSGCAKPRNRKTVHPERRVLSLWWRVTEFNSLATLRRRQRAPELVDARGLHMSKILDVLSATKLDLKERWVMIDVESLELPENDGSIFLG